MSVDCLHHYDYEEIVLDGIRCVLCVSYFAVLSIVVIDFFRSVQLYGGRTNEECGIVKNARGKRVYVHLSCIVSAQSMPDC